MLNITISTILCAVFAIIITFAIPKMIRDVKHMHKECSNQSSNEASAAVREFQLAEQQFNYANSDYVDAAIYRRKAAEERLQNLIREKRAM